NINEFSQHWGNGMGAKRFRRKRKKQRPLDSCQLVEPTISEAELAQLKKEAEKQAKLTRKLEKEKLKNLEKKLKEKRESVVQIINPIPRKISVESNARIKEQVSYTIYVY